MAGAACGISTAHASDETAVPAAVEVTSEPISASPGLSTEEDLSSLGLEELMQIEVTSVAGVGQTLQKTPAALFAITPEDIRRGGFRSIAESLRIVPGMQVAQIDNPIWAISSRGFNGRFADKLLVLIDGRSVYTPTFSGVFWDSQQVVLEDLDRIEVIRGPGATLWGSNAVNGVINVVTKSAKETQGLLLSAGAGTEEQGFGTVRYGGKIDENAYFRVYSQYFSRDGLPSTLNSIDTPDWRDTAAGLRLDMDGDDDTTFTVQSDAHTSRAGERVQMLSTTPPLVSNITPDTETTGGNVLARISRAVSPESGWTLQAYYDRTNRDSIVYHEQRDTGDLDFRHHFNLGESQAIIWGLGVRVTTDEYRNTEQISYFPTSRTSPTYTAFAQNTVSIIKDRLSLMVGSKFEHNDYTGFEVQPSGRLSWTPDEHQTIWGSISRAVRTPNRANSDIALLVGVIPPPITPVPVGAYLLGDPSLQSEELLAYEAGYRVIPVEHVTLDLAAYFNDYRNLMSIGPGPVPPNVVSANDQSGDTMGLEAAATWRIAENWRISAGYTWENIVLHGGDEGAEGLTPSQQVNLRSYLNVTDNVEFNAAAYFVDRIPAQNIDSYIRVDLGITWRPRPNVEIAVWGQNLLDPGHVEFIDTFFVVQPVEAQRGVYAQVTIQF